MRSMVVSPSATSPARISDADARRSVAITGAPLSCSHAAHDRGVAFDADVGAQAQQLLHVHEAVLEDRLVDHADAFGDAVHRHELRLHVGRERRVRRGGEVDRARAAAPHVERDAVAVDVDVRAGLLELVEHRVERVRRACGAR